ncbi:TetR/AcrR family transcriptional regulator [Olivibacter sp. SDN3]|uniref:TetR/AcrR family transcriptional regulator n=1 Tax=Olivibacter sp. SDN3 TaxID=2764720 RepID=UPI0016513F66|nr:TetR/AcrR family transcriptional regulator [Olivibacter sp. SDN3]QNL49602.1 TetR/AcrR family transcriptional regulator [Olivibacter sp. SDN3]
MAKEKKDVSTEEKIKEAARVVFTKKGFAATRTRDIAEEAGLNLALLNYYFRSKEKLFHIVMDEKFEQFFGMIIRILNNEDTSLEEKIYAVANDYIDMLLANPDLPIFVLSEIKNNPTMFSDRIAGKLMASTFFRQLNAVRTDINVFHFILNLLSMIIFPVLAQPVISQMDVLKDKAFANFILERKKLIPLWFNTMLHTK